MSLISITDYKAQLCEIEDIILNFNMSNLIPRLEALKESFDSEKIVDIVVMGRFKAGKSSLINSLIGEKIIPTSIIPVTSIITRIYYGESDRVIVHYLDGNVKVDKIENLSEYVTESKNPQNEKNISVVDLELTNLATYKGLRFVDTPGLGSVFLHNTETTLKWVPRVGAVILAISSDNPLSEQDINLLKELSSHTPETAILLSKIDLISLEQLNEILEFLNVQIERHFNKSIKIFPFSTKQGYEEYRKRFIEDYLLSKFSNQNADEYQKIQLHKMVNLISGCKEYLELARQSALTAEKAREELRRNLQNEKRQLTEVQNEIRIISTDLKTRLRSRSLELFLERYPQLSKNVKAAFKDEIHTWNGNLKVLTEHFKKWLKSKMAEEISAISPSEGEKLIEFIETAEETFRRVIRAFQDRMASHIEKALNMSFKGVAFEMSIERPNQPDIRIERIFDTPLELIWFLIPMTIFRPLVNKYFYNLIPWEVEKNLHRAASQWSDLICESIDEMSNYARNFIFSEIETIEKLVDTTDDRVEYINLMYEKLGALKNSINENEKY